jgi:hypothetical protein
MGGPVRIWITIDPPHPLVQSYLLIGIVRIFHGFLSKNTLYGFMLKIYDFVKNGLRKKVYVVH